MHFLKAEIYQINQIQSPKNGSFTIYQNRFQEKSEWQKNAEISTLCSTFPDEFCDGYPHNLIPTPGYWIECSRAISNQGSAWTNEERDLQEIDEGITDSPDGSIRDASVLTDFDQGSDSNTVPR